MKMQLITSKGLTLQTLHKNNLKILVFDTLSTIIRHYDVWPPSIRLRRSRKINQRITIYLN